MTRLKFALTLVTALILFTGVSIAQDCETVENNPFTNCGFETGDFTGWTVEEEEFSGGTWFVYSGPNFAGLDLPPPEGEYAAVTGQIGAGAQVLYQDISVPGNSFVTCSVIVYYFSESNLVNGPELTATIFPNQQARIDIMDPDADVFGVGPGVLLNIFQTNAGDPLNLGYTTIEFDLSQFSGSIVRFRAAEVDNQGPFNFAIDDVTCEEASIVRPIPTLSEWGLIAMAGLIGITGLLVLKRRKAAV